MKKICSVIVLLFLVLVPVRGASGFTVTVTPASKVTGSGPYLCIRSGNGQVCYPMRIPSTSKSTGTSRVLIRVNSQPTSSTPTLPTTAPNTSSGPSLPVQEDLATTNSSSMQQEMLGYINAERAKVNAPALILDQKLSDGAYVKSKDMALNNYFSHTSPTYGSPFDMMKSLGITYRAAGENIAKHTSVKGAHDAFMDSPGHKANILNTSFKKIGLGFYTYGHYLYVTQWFTN
ncbi:MAG: CAP domain-containing protein [Deltaproteobacteria bacterium]